MGWKLKSRLSLDREVAQWLPWAPPCLPSCPNCSDDSVWSLDSGQECARSTSSQPLRSAPTPAAPAVYSWISRAHTAYLHALVVGEAPGLWKCPLNLWRALPKGASANFSLKNVALLNPSPEAFFQGHLTFQERVIVSIGWIYNSFPSFPCSVDAESNRMDAL